jgi:hypothetical protein
MTTYAPNYTPRWRGRYLAGGIEHTIQVRTQRGQSAFITQGLGAFVRSLFFIYQDTLASDFAWLSAEYAVTDSDDFVPMSPPAAVVGGASLAGFSLKQRCTSTNFNGRAVGSRAALYLYGIQWDEGLSSIADNGRVSPAEDPNVTAVAAIATTNFFANSGTQATWHQYANIKVNDHLLKLLRRGTIS